MDIEQEASKPYELIPLAAGGAQRQESVGHAVQHRGRLTGRLRFVLFPRVPVQVASGAFAVARTRQGEVIASQPSLVARYDEAGTTQSRPVIPGSSLKGTLRTLVEMLSPSCVPIAGRKSQEALPADAKPCTDQGALCPACQLFGMVGSQQESYQGQVSIEDAPMQKGKRTITRGPALWSPANSRGRQLPDRYLTEEGLVRGRKLYYHSTPARGEDTRIAIAVGSQLPTWLHFANLSPGQLGLLLAAWGLHPSYPFLPKVGAGKPIGLGTVEVHLTRAELYGSGSQTGRMGQERMLYKGEALNEQVSAWFAAAHAEALLLPDTLEAVYEVLRAETLARPPHDEPY